MAAQTINVHLPVPVSPIGVGQDSGAVLASPDDPRQLIACGVRISSKDGMWQGFVHHSDDGGGHWTTALVDSTPGHLVSEEACAFGTDDHAYFIAETWNYKPERRRLGGGIVRIYRSLDAGRTWSPTFIDPTPASWMDFAQIGVDLTDGPYRGRVYLFSNLFIANWMPGAPNDPGPLRYSADGGLHFSDRVTLPLAHVPNAGGFPQSVLVLPSGTLVVTYANRDTKNGAPYAVDNQRTKTRIQVMRSTDGGHTFGSPITVAEDVSPSMAVDESDGSHRGRLYLAFENTVMQVRRVLLTTSDDEGKTWAPTQVVDDWSLRHPSDQGSPPGAPMSQVNGIGSPRIAVNRDGLLGISWDEDGCSRFAASLDGGSTFLSSVPLYECPRHDTGTFPFGTYLTARSSAYSVDRLAEQDPQRKAFTILVARYNSGNAGLTADAAGAFHPSFFLGPDGRLWTTRVAVEAKAIGAAPEPDTEGLRDVSQHVTFTFTELGYDQGTGLVTVELTLINNDSEAIKGPVRLELTRMGSMLFRHLEAVNADNHVTGPGAIWDLSSGLPRGILDGYATASPRRLVFRVADGPVSVDLLGQQLTVPLFVADVKIFGALNTSASERVEHR